MTSGVGKAIPAPSTLNEVLREIAVGNVTTVAKQWTERIESGRKEKEREKAKVPVKGGQPGGATAGSMTMRGRGAAIGMRTSRGGVVLRGVARSGGAGGPMYRGVARIAHRCARCGGAGHKEVVCPNRFR